MDYSASDLHTHSTKPKLLHRFLRGGGSSKDKVQYHSFGNSDLSPKGRRTSLTGSPIKVEASQALHDSQSPPSQRASVSTSSSAVDSRNASPSDQRGPSIDYKRDITELDDLIKSNLETGGSKKKTSMSPPGRKKKIPSKVASTSPTHNKQPYHQIETEAMGKSSSSSIGLTKTYSGISLASAEKSVKNAKGKMKSLISHSESNDATSIASKNTLHRGLKKENADPSFVARFTSALNADRRRMPPHSPSPSPSPSQSRSTTPRKVDNVREITTNGILQSTTPKARSRASPPRSLTINNNIPEFHQAATSPLSVGLSSQSSAPETSNSNGKSSLKMKGKGQHDPPPFDENATAREVLDAIAAQKTKTNIKSPKPQMKVKTSSKEATQITNRNQFSPISLALGLVGGIGAAVQTCSECACGEGDDSLFQENSSGGSIFGRNSSLMTMDTYEREQLLDDIERFERMNSFDTLGTMNTANTMTTLNTIGTNDTGYTSVMTGTTGEAFDDNGNLIPVDVVKDHYFRKQVTNKLNLSVAPEKKKKKRKKKKKKKKSRKKVVGFEYPPISTLKEIPRINSEERKKLFFTEDELEEYESDRKYNVSDDVEVVAVEGSDSEEEETESESDDDDDEDSIDKWIAGKTGDTFGQSQNAGVSALRPGKYANKKESDTGSTRPPIRVDESFGTATKNSRSTSVPRGRRNSSEGLSEKSSSSSSKPGNNGNGGEASKGKKLKGVQIYLRQRSKAS